MRMLVVGRAEWPEADRQVGALFPGDLLE